MLRKGAIQQLKSQPGEFLSNLFLVNKKDGGNKSCNKSQISEQLHTLPKFQNGRNAFNKGSSPRTRLSDRDRSKRCLFWHTSRQKLRKIYLFLMGREFIRIPLLMFWPGSRPSDFHETSEDTSCLIKEDQCKNNNIFGRHTSNSPNVERNFASKEGIDFFVTKFMFCDKFKKVATNTSEGNRVS